MNHHNCMKTPVLRGGVHLSSLMAAAVLSVSAVAYADSTVTVDGVAQRWPWNNKVDITYTVSGGQTRSAGVYCGLDFTLTAGGQTFAIAGSSIGASAENGTHTVTWTAPKGIVDANCSMTATLFTTNVPSGNDYMIVDLDSGAVWYEGLFATQELSNERYNTAAYKENLFVLRKIPKWADKDSLPNADSLPAAGYPTGDSVHYATSNSSANWMTDKDYYMGVFLITQKQFEKIDNLRAALYRRTDITGNNKDHRPFDYIRLNELRGTATLASDTIPTVDSKTGTFFQKFNFITGNKYKFDLPTEVMWEIAGRAGATTTYYWGDTMGEEYCCSRDTAWLIDPDVGRDVYSNIYPWPVGSFKPNAWGFYDIQGNMREWMRDDWTTVNLSARNDPFTPCDSTATPRHVSTIVRGGGMYSISKDEAEFRTSARSGAQRTNVDNRCGIRVSLIVE